MQEQTEFLEAEVVQVLHPWVFSKRDAIKPWATCSDPFPDPATSRKLVYRAPEVLSRLNYFIILFLFSSPN